ncbi:MAG TPA: GNAT family N-acetyltransferase [Methylocella sp.]|nr:GNAT family N-acetyltransferase [Methylocella sp.]
MKKASPRILEAGHDTDLYRAMVALRSEVLRKPLGLSFTAEQLREEANQRHLALMVEGSLAGCLLLAPEEGRIVKFRQMAIAPCNRGKGLGKELLLHAETIAMQNGYRGVRLHARESAAGFYEKMGYRRVGERFIEVTIPHVKMQKELA